MNAITFRNRFRVTYQRMHAAVHPAQATLALRKPRLWRRLTSACWVLYRGSDLRRARGTPGIVFDALVASLFLVLGAANLFV